MAIPNFTTLALDRIKLCNEDIATADETVFRTWSSEALIQYPAIACLIGAITPAGFFMTPSTNTLVIPRTYIISAFLAPLEGDINDGASGSMNYESASTFPDRFVNYYATKPRLETNSLEALQYVSEDIQFNDGGIGERMGFGGLRYIAYDFRLVVTMSYEWERTY